LNLVQIADSRQGLVRYNLSHIPDLGDYGLTKNAKTISLAAIAAMMIVVLIIAGRDVYLRRQAELNCGDGPRRVIDLRDFTIQNSGYSLELEANIKDKGRISTKLAPVQLQQLSEAMQNAQEFRKFVVAGYNSCAVTKVQYSQYGSKFQVLDNLAREINQLSGSRSLSTEQNKSLTSLISEYAHLARKGASD
jgi:hypothetical protein